MKKITAALAVMLLAGCSSGPSSDAMEEALLDWMHQIADRSATIEEFSHGDCTERGDSPGFACSVQARITYMGGRQQDTMEGTFVFDKIDGKWKVVGRTM